MLFIFILKLASRHIHESDINRIYFRFISFIVMWTLKMDEYATILFSTNVEIFATYDRQDYFKTFASLHREIEKFMFQCNPLCNKWIFGQMILWFQNMKMKWLNKCEKKKHVNIIKIWSESSETICMNWILSSAA